jgi:hypothetical protein
MPLKVIGKRLLQYERQRLCFSVVLIPRGWAMARSTDFQKSSTGDSDVQRLAYFHTEDGFREPTADPYEFKTLNRDDDHIRIFVLEPCNGDLNAPHNYVKGRFEVTPLATARSFIAITHGRGYRLLKEVIEIDGKSLLISTALERFLRHLRKPDVAVRLWVRYICVDEQNPQEQGLYWTRDFVDKVYGKADELVDMHSELQTLLADGRVERFIDSRYKTWKKNWDTVPESAPLPRVFPIKLGKRISHDNPVEDHEYLPLDPVAGEIRLVVVANNPDPAAPLVLHLAHCPPASDVQYHALSYTWGNEPESKEVNVNGQRMLIRPNLDSALRSLRSPTNDLAVWVDAICINQRDTLEKNQQIPRMGHILEKAMTVICYTGEADEHSELALDFVKLLRQPMIRMDNERNFQVGHPDRIPPDKLPLHCAALYQFFMRPYFRRAWVLQEVSLASNPLIICGKNRDTSFEQLDFAAYNLRDMLIRDPTLSSKMASAIPHLDEISPDQLLFVRKLFYFRHLHIGRAPRGFIIHDIKNTSPGYLETAILSRDFQATVPHDKLFALWNIARDKNGFDFLMDYSKSCRDAFAEFAMAFALHTGSLDIIAAAEPTHSATRSSLDPGAPSWVPDWSRPSQSSCLVRKEAIRGQMMMAQDDMDGAVYSADGSLVQTKGDDNYFHFIGDELHCLGIILDEILAVGGSEETVISENVGGLVFATAAFCAEQKFEAYNDVRQAIIAMLHGDVPESWPRREDNLQNVDDEYPEEYVCIPYKPKLLQDRTPNASRYVPLYGASYCRQEAWEAVASVTRGRRVFISDKGYVGTMPVAAADRGFSRLRLAILATCSVPVLLREHPTLPDTYSFCGSCFVQGWMTGEILCQEMGCDTPAEFWLAMAGSRKLKIV